MRRGRGARAVGAMLAAAWGKVQQQLRFNKGIFQLCVASCSPAQTCSPFQKQHCEHTGLPGAACCGARVIPAAPPGPILRNTEPVCCGSRAGVEVGGSLLSHSGSHGGEPGLEGDQGGASALSFFLSGRCPCTPRGMSPAISDLRLQVFKPLGTQG